MTYVFDKTAQVSFEKIISSSDLSKDGKVLLQKFYELNISNIIPKAVFGEYFRSDFASFRSIPKNMTSSGLLPVLSRDESNNSMEYTFCTEEDRGCREINIANIGEVHKPEIEAIVYCLRNNGMIFVTDDEAAIELCNSLGVECLKFKNFLKKAGIDRYFLNN